MVINASSEKRFWAKVDKSGECWVWTAGKNDVNYGQFWTGSYREKRSDE